MSFKPKTKPAVGISEQLWTTLLRMSRSTNYEFSALGSVEQKEDKEFYIRDLLFPKQTNTLTSTEIDEDLAANMDNNPALRCWIRSHTQWDLQWTEEDEDYIKGILNATSEENWMISMILNHTGECAIRLDVSNAASLMGRLFSTNTVVSFTDLPLTKYYSAPMKEQKEEWENHYAAVATETPVLALGEGRVNHYINGYPSSNPFKGSQKNWGKSWENTWGEATKASYSYGTQWDGYSFVDDEEHDSVVDLGECTAMELGVPSPEVVTGDSTDLPYGDSLLFCIDAVDPAEVHNMYPFANTADLFILAELASNSGDQSTASLLDEEELYECVGDYLTHKRSMKDIVNSICPGQSVDKLRKAALKNPGFPLMINRIKKSPRKPVITKRAWQGLLKTQNVQRTEEAALDYFIGRMGAELGLLPVRDVASTLGCLGWWKTTLPEEVAADLAMIAPWDHRFRDTIKALRSA